MTAIVQDKPDTNAGILETIRYSESRIMQRYTRLSAPSTQYPDAIPTVYVRTVASTSEEFTKWAVLTGTVVT